MFIMKRFNYKAKDGKTISVVEWTVEAPCGVVQLSHGMSEHILRYEGLAKALNDAGYIVFGDDHRSFGFTDEKTQGYHDGDAWEGSLSDMNGLTLRYRKKYKGLPLVLLGHSYGSFLMQAYIERFGNDIDGAILVGSCMMKNPSVDIGLLAAKIGCAVKGKQAKANFIKKLTFDSYDKKFKQGDFINSIQQESDLYKEDPMCGAVCSYNFYRTFFTGLKKVYKKDALNAIPKDLPLLLVAGEDDPVGEMGSGMKKLKKMYDGLGIESVKLCLYPNNRHEILRDRSKDEAIGEVLTFLSNICKK